MKQKMDKKGEIPFYLVMMILVLVSLIVIMFIVFAMSGKMQDFIAWLGEVW